MCTHFVLRETNGAYIKAHSIQVHLSEFHVFVLFSCFSAFSQEKSIWHTPVKKHVNSEKALHLSKQLEMDA